MNTRVTTDDLANAVVALQRTSESMIDGPDDSDYDEHFGSLLRVAAWLEIERQRRYQRMGKRSLPKLLGGLTADRQSGVAVTEKDEQR